MPWAFSGLNGQPIPHVPQPSQAYGPETADETKGESWMRFRLSVMIEMRADKDTAQCTAKRRVVDERA